MNDFQKKTIETAAAKLKAATDELTEAQKLLQANKDSQASLQGVIESYQRSLDSLKKGAPELSSAVERARDKAIEAEEHYEYVCREYAGASPIPPKPLSIFEIFTGGRGLGQR